MGDFHFNQESVLILLTGNYFDTDSKGWDSQGSIYRNRNVGLEQPTRIPDLEQDRTIVEGMFPNRFYLEDIEALEMLACGPIHCGLPTER
jgi:hypothetical protein